MATSSVVRETYHQAFAGPCAELVELAGLGMTISVGAGRTIVIEGDPIEHVYRVISGSVRLYKAVADGRRQIIDFLGASECFGLMDLDEHAYSAEAITDVVMVRYQRQRLETLIEERAELSHQLFRLACSELKRAQRRMLLLGRKSAEERVASFLLDLAEQQQAGEGGEIYLAMSRQDIADHLGLTIETVSRIFTRFKAAGMIGLPDRHAVRLSDVERLSSMADCSRATI
ncbi:MAG: helix-turn-helix domain-containing protein [Rhizobiales bacterium]|nr:helix-turn-helix domain-containing protein [Hyphomicrobiales bacterium]